MILIYENFTYFEKLKKDTKEKQKPNLRGKITLSSINSYIKLLGGGEF